MFCHDSFVFHEVNEHWSHCSYLQKHDPEEMPQNDWMDKGAEFKGTFKNFCDQEGIVAYTTSTTIESATAERDIRPLKNSYKHLEHKWIYHLYFLKHIESICWHHQFAWKLSDKVGVKKICKNTYLSNNLLQQRNQQIRCKTVDINLETQFG